MLKLARMSVKRNRGSSRLRSRQIRAIPRERSLITIVSLMRTRVSHFTVNVKEFSVFEERVKTPAALAEEIIK